MEIDISNSISLNKVFNTTKDILNSIENIISKRETQGDFAIDRFEEKQAICENLKTKEIIDIPLNTLPHGSKVNDIITISNGNITINKSLTKERKSYIKSLVNDIYEKK